MKRRTFLGLTAGSLLAATQQSLGSVVNSPLLAALPKQAHDGADGSTTAEEGIHVRFLGTGAADWNGRDERGELRRLSSILLNRHVLIDFTPSDEDMLPADIHPKAIFYTHSHSDHFNAAAALKLGVEQVYLSQTWHDIAMEEFQRAAQKLRLPMPALNPVCIGQHITVDGLTFTPLPANHTTGHILEQCLIYLIERGHTRLLYATDTGGIMGVASRLAGIDAHQAGKAITGLIMEATMGLGHEIDYRYFTHSSVATVQKTVEVLAMTKRYLPPAGQKVYITHMARTLHGTQKELDQSLPDPIAAAWDGLEVTFKPNPAV